MAVAEITKSNFEDVVMKSTKPVLLDFWASWCGPCMMLSPLVDEASEETDSVVFGKVNVDSEPELAASFGIESIPFLALIENGKLVRSSVGYIPKDALMRFIKG